MTHSERKMKHPGELCQILLCQVVLGVNLLVETAKPKLTKEKMKKLECDSLTASPYCKEKGGVEYEESVIYHPTRAIPRFIITYKPTFSCFDYNNV